MNELMANYKFMSGIRERNDDGFTYVYGKHKSGRKKHSRNAKQTDRCVRADKKKVKNGLEKIDFACFDVL